MRAWVESTEAFGGGQTPETRWDRVRSAVVAPDPFDRRLDLDVSLGCIEQRYRRVEERLASGVLVRGDVWTRDSGALGERELRETGRRAGGAEEIGEDNDECIVLDTLMVPCMYSGEPRPKTDAFVDTSMTMIRSLQWTVENPETTRQPEVAGCRTIFLGDPHHEPRVECRGGP